MKFAVLSDVHANLEALTAVFGDIEGHGVDEIVCLGDIVGYHADPNECVELIRGRVQVCIAGNHDRAAVGLLDPGDFGRVARAAIDWTRRRLTPQNRQFLQGLPLTANVHALFSCVHGALHPEPNETLHLSSPARIEKSFERLRAGALGARICLFGHTHRSVAYCHDGHACTRLSLAELDLTGDAYWLINPGSVGQPRDGNPHASYLMFDSLNRTIRFHRVPFDHESCQRKARREGLLFEPSLTEKSADVLADQLARGRSLLSKLGRSSKRLV